MDSDLAAVDYMHVWADGIHLDVRLEEAKARVLVLIAVRADGSKEPVALKDGYRESGESATSARRFHPLDTGQDPDHQRRRGK
ncbi:hypothetical protein ACIRUV_15865 [Streptomyces noursei]|uniref:hypothetical protein n=1 Tax=Streptomyces noursei TaxID=1971 RepID=UPI00381A0D4F